MELPAPTPRTMRVSALQWEPVKGDVSANWAIAERLLTELGDGAGDLAVMPEMALTGYVWRDRSAIEPLAAQCSSDDTHRLWVEASARFGAWLVVGHPAVDEETGSLRNRCTLVSPGGIVGHYDKTCLFPEDTHWASAGTTPPPVWDTPWGRISPLICADIDYPEPLNHAVHAGAELIVLPTAWVEEPAPSATWTLRATEVGVPLVAADIIGVDEGVVFPGGSCVIDAGGTVLDSLAYSTGSVTGEVELGHHPGTASRAQPVMVETSLAPVSTGQGDTIQVAVAPSLESLSMDSLERAPSSEITVFPLASVADDEARLEVLDTLQHAARIGQSVVVGGVVDHASGVAEIFLSRQGETCVRVSSARLDDAGVWRREAQQAETTTFLVGDVLVGVLGAWELADYWPVRALAARGVHLVLTTGPASIPVPSWRADSQAPFVLPLGGEEDYFGHLARLRAGENNVWLAYASNHPAIPGGVFSPNHVWWPRREVLAEGNSWAVAPCTIDTGDPWGSESAMKPLVSSRRQDLYPDAWTWQG